MDRTTFGDYLEQPRVADWRAWWAPWRAFVAMWSREHGQAEFWVGLGLLGWGVIRVLHHPDRGMTGPLWLWEAKAVCLGAAMLVGSIADARWWVRIACDIAAAMFLADVEIDLLRHSGLYGGAAFNFVLIGMALTSAAKAAGRERMRRSVG